MRRLFALGALLAFGPAFATARYVYPVVGGQLHDCGQPSHNSRGVAGDTSAMSVCVNGLQNNNARNRIICDDVSGCADWTTTTGICTNPVVNNGNVVALANGATVNFSTPRTASPDEHVVYGTPQACVYNMAKSDSCEIHAGTYAKAGAQSTSAGVLPTNLVDRSDGWLASLVMFGYGPNMGTTGYGTASNPAYVRGAVLAGATDTWDSNGNGVPDAEEGTCSGGSFNTYLCKVGASECTGGSCVSSGITSYPVIFDGNFDGDGSLNEATACPTNGADCAGDGFYALIWGCGNVSTDGGNCLANLGGGQTRPKVDSDANGSFDADANSGGPRNVSYVTLKDIEFKNYNGGAATCSANGIREALGSITMAGGGTTSANGDGFIADHIYYHDNTYSGLCQSEHYVAVFGDDENWACSSAATTIPGTVVQVAGEIISNSLIVNKNRSIVNDDCDATQPGASECGCSKYFYNDHFVLANTTAGQYQNFMRWKSVNTVANGTRPKRLVWINTQFTIQRADSGGSTYIFTPECTGLCDPGHVANGANGVIQVNGSIIRYQGSGVPAIHRFSESFCGDTFRYCENGTTPCSGTGVQAACSGIGGGTCSLTEAAGVNYTFKSFLNTLDLDKFSAGGNTALDYLCNTNGSLVVQHHNAYFGVSTVHTETATTTRRNTVPVGNDVCSASSQTSCTTDATGRTGWWTTGTQNAPLYGALSNYIPKSGGPLYEKTSACDPDGDGTVGVDYYGTGTSVTTWTDIAGNIVDCSTGGNPTGLLSYAARQPNSDTPVAPSQGPQRRRRVATW